MLDIERIWNAIMRVDYALERTTLDNVCKAAIKPKMKQIESLKANLISYMQALKDNGLINSDINSYEEYLQSNEIKKWIIDNAPKDYDFSKGYYDEGNPFWKSKGERDYPSERRNVSMSFIKRYIRSSGYENPEEAKECYRTLAKKFGVSEYTIGKCVQEHFKIEKRDEIIYKLKKRKEEKMKQ